jgi:dipeptidyl aminopeptidase/acylaminoacyl peptidase
MKRDIRDTPTFQDIERRYEAWLQVGSGRPSGFGDVALSPDGRRIAGVSAVTDKLEGMTPTRLCVVDVESGEIDIQSQGPNTDRAPAWSPDGGRLAFISDRDGPYDFQVRVRDIEAGAERPLPVPAAFAEYLHWSPDGASLLIGAAGTGADLAGAQGGIASPLGAEEAPAWAPAVDTGVKETSWRALWLADAAGGEPRRVTPGGVNVWEGTWCGPDKAVVSASDEPGEEVWYTATLRLVDIASGEVRDLYAPKDQIGWISASASGRKVAFVEAVCSDRTIVAGDLKILDVTDGTVTTIDTHGVDVTFTAWQGEDHVLYCGHRSFETELGLVDVAAGAARPLWTSDTYTFGDMRYPVFSKGATPGDCAFVKEGFLTPPQVVLFTGGRERIVAEVAPRGVADLVAALGTAEPYRWTAPDELEIHGWLVQPKAPGPHPLILQIHGGPVWLWRQHFLGRAAAAQALLAAGYALLYPNPRGSSGRGQDYARQVFGDMGGKDTYDYLSGVDALVAAGVADPLRIGLTGGSYGGFMSSWLVTQDQRFAAAVPVAPVTDWVSEHLTCHIPHFCSMFLDDEMTNPGGKYFTRSPIMFTDRVKTPCLNICGALDRNTPAGQAEEFHHALLLDGVQSALVKYPQEGHGCRNFPAVIDYSARMLDWFEDHMPATARIDQAAE